MKGKRVKKVRKTNNNKFIMTNDKHTKNKLLEIGYKLISSNGNVYTFETNPTLNFSSLDNLKVAYTNTLTF